MSTQTLVDRAPVLELDGPALRQALRVIVRQCPCIGGCLDCEDALRLLRRSIHDAQNGVTA